MKKTFKPGKQPKTLFKTSAPSTAKPAAPKPIDESQLRHVAGGADLPHTRW